MTTFQVQPSTPYDIEIGQPGIAGSPTPTVSYAWTYDGTPIGGNSRFVTNYTFPSFPATLACTITLTNIVGSVNQTVTATIEQVSNLPTLSPVTIRNNSAPTVPISTIANGNAGAVIRVGGPTAADVNPIASNATTVSYQWRRGLSDIAGATGQTYTLVAADDDQTLSVVVTATNLDGSTARTASLVIGNAWPNASSKIGAHLPTVLTHSQSNIAFANLAYSAQIKWVGGKAATNTNPSTLWEDYAGDPFCTADGWPIKNIDGSPLSTTKPAEMWLSVNKDMREWSILQIPGEYTTSTEGETQLPPDNIRGKRVTYTVSVYWQGTGSLALRTNKSDNLSETSEENVSFAGPLGEGPWGTGPVDMRMKSWTRLSGENCIAGGEFKLFITSTDQNDPVRNIVILIKDVRDVLSAQEQDNTWNVVLGDTIYEGFDHTNYTPYALYPAWVEANKRMKIFRNHDQTKITHEDNVEYAAADPEYYANGDGDAVVVRRVGWLHPPNSYGFETGYGAMNRPTHVLHGVSLKAQIEACNQMRADWWHSHPVNVVYAGTRSEGQPDAFAALGDVKSLLIDQDYITNLVPFIAANLEPGLKVYSELCNELWNFDGAFNWNHNFAFAMGSRIKADVVHGGDGNAVRSFATLGADAYFAGKKPQQSYNARAERLFSFLGSALLAKEMRELIPANGFEVVATAGVQFGGITNEQTAIGQAFMRCPKLFKELDAVAIAPYRSPTFDPGIDPPGTNASSPEADANLVSLGSADAAWEWLEEVQGQLDPYSIPIGAQDSNGDDVLNGNSFWASGLTRTAALLGYSSFARWKHLALDVGYSFQYNGGSSKYSRIHLFPGAPARRWNLKLVCYEAGNHYNPNRRRNPDGPRAKEIFAGCVMAAPYRRFMRRYYETLFAPNIKGEVRDPAAGTTENEIYRPGMVPNGIAQEREPIIDHCVMLSTIGPPNYRKGMYWALMWFTSQVNSPQAIGLEESVDLGIGTPNWWVNYTGYLE